MRSLVEAVTAKQEPGLCFLFDISKEAGEAHASMLSAAQDLFGQPLEDGGEPHITALYMGRGHTAEEVQSIAESAVDALRAAPRPMAIPTKVSFFPPGPSSEGRTPIIMLFDPARLEPINTRLLRATAKANNQNQFVDYRPHMTLGYLPREVTMVEAAMLGQIRTPGTILPTKLVLSWGHEPVAQYIFG